MFHVFECGKQNTKVNDVRAFSLKYIRTCIALLYMSQHVYMRMYVPVCMYVPRVIYCMIVRTEIFP